MWQNIIAAGENEFYIPCRASELVANNEAQRRDSPGQPVSVRNHVQALWGGV